MKARILLMLALTKTSDGSGDSADVHRILNRDRADPGDPACGSGMRPSCGSVAVGRNADHGPECYCGFVSSPRARSQFISRWATR